MVTLFIHFKFHKFIFRTVLIIFLISPFYSFIFNYSHVAQRFSTTDIDYHINTFDDRTMALKKSPDIILNNIFGRGNKDFRIKVNGNNIVPHNMFITSLLAGGIISFLGFILIVYRTLKSIKKLYKKSVLSPFEMSLASIFFLISITFFTIEFFGFNLLIYFSIYFYFNYKSTLLKND